MDNKIEKLTLFGILMVFSVLCINQNIKASETSGEVIDKRADHSGLQHHDLQIVHRQKC